MSAPQLYPEDHDTAAARVATTLVLAYTALHRAAAHAAALVETDLAYRGTRGWDLQLAVTDSRVAIENAVCVHDLAQFHPFWSHPRSPQPDGPALTLAVSDAHQQLAAALAEVFTALSSAAADAETLIASAHHYANRHGYIGGLGWDLETAIDDALIAVRDAARAAELATTGPSFWKDKL